MSDSYLHYTIFLISTNVLPVLLLNIIIHPEESMYEEIYFLLTWNVTWKVLTL